MQTRRLYVTALALFALAGFSTGGDAPDVLPCAANAAPPSNEAAAPQPDASVVAVIEHLTRYAQRTGLTEPEIRVLAATIVAEAQRHELDPGLVLAVMHVESRYNPYAVSSKRAVGLMQILPSTGEWLAPQVGVEWRGPQTLFDPVSNARLGVAYLRQLVDRYDGSISTALAAYNWGPGHIDGRLRRGVPLPTVYAQLVLGSYVKKS